MRESKRSQPGYVNPAKGRKRGPDPAHIKAKRIAARAANQPSFEERFWAKVDRSGGPNACWLFTSTAERKGYGVVWYEGKVCYAHRVSWLLAGNTLDAGKVIDHICRVPKCVNPSHLRLVTPAENCYAGIAQPAVNARRTHCRNGHEYTPENTAIKETWCGKTRHGYPRQSPVRGRMCITCFPSMWRYAMAKRGPPKGLRPRKLEWVGPWLNHHPKRRTPKSTLPD